MNSNFAQIIKKIFSTLFFLDSNNEMLTDNFSNYTFVLWINYKKGVSYNLYTT